MPFFHRITILLYQSNNNIASAVFRCAAERREEKGKVLSCVKNRRRLTYDDE
jgi:D-alanyl-D-alanine carboxypeptidase